MEILKVYKGKKMINVIKKENVLEFYKDIKEFFEERKILIRAGKCLYQENDGQFYKGYFIELI